MRQEPATDPLHSAFPLREILVLIPGALVIALVVVVGPLVVAKALGLAFVDSPSFEDNFFLVVFALEAVNLAVVAAYVLWKLRATNATLAMVGFRYVPPLRAIRSTALAFLATVAVTVAGIITVLLVLTVLAGGVAPEPPADAQGFTLGSLWRDILLVSVLAPVLEEVVYRGLLLEQLLRRYSSVVAVTLSSLLFAVSHINPIHALGVLPMGFALGLLYKRLDSIWPCIALHAVWNLLVTLLVHSG